MSHSLRHLFVAWLVVPGGHAAAADEPAPDVPTIEVASFLDLEKAGCGIQQGIDTAAARGGGVVLLPPGTFRLRRGLVIRDNVSLAGAGMEKTILMPERQVRRLDVAADGPDQNQVTLSEIPDELAVGCAVVSCRSYPPAWYGSPRPAVVTAIDREAKTVTLEAPCGLNKMTVGKGYLTFGVAASLAQDVRKGDTEITLRNASLFRPGDELALGEPPNESLLAHVFVREVRGNTLVLEQPAQVDFECWIENEKIGNKRVNALVWALFPLVHAANVKDCAVRDLTIRGHDMSHVRPTQTRYTLAGIHIFNGTRVTIERVAVRVWPSDGISLQTGSHCRVADCEISGCLGNGLHPGTSLTDTYFERNTSTENGSGLYFCWHNRRHRLVKNQFVKNRGGGITGLGNPGDRENIIEDNYIAENGGAGIEINGGGKSGNAIRGNVIENNSQDNPGKHPGIAIYASVEDAREYTVARNTIRDTQDVPTQHVGIEERNGERRGKRTFADENRIEGNSLSGHKVADIVLRGQSTVCDKNGDALVKRHETK